MNEEYLLDRLQKLDKKIEEKERALLHVNKQRGSIISGLRKLKEERVIVSGAYKEETE